MKYLIDVPPPTISGLLHMGHVFSYCHMDLIANSQRVLNEKELLYPFCFDCNGLPTEKLAKLKNIEGQENIIEFAKETSKTYATFFNNLGIKWSDDQYHTFDDNAIALAELSFQDLKQKGLVYKATRDYFWCPLHKVSVSQSEIDENGRYERSGVKVEIKTGEGWFVNMLEHIPRIRQCIDSIEWHPIIFRDRLHSWLDSIKYDWSISRERDYGIQIPGEPKGIVFDTWFTSSLSPQMTYSSHIGHPSLQCPIFDVRFQAHDIIRTWALFTIVKSLYHNNQPPWKNIVISGHALDSKGRKISKTAGNFVSPMAYIEKYGMDGVRYWASLNQIGTDTRCDEQVMLKGKKLVNKIKNASKFVYMGQEKGGDNLEYLKEANEIIDKISNFIVQDYNWPLAIQTLTDFFWHVFCDKWIEECKIKPIYNTLKQVLDKLIKEFSIFFPNLTLHF